MKKAIIKIELEYDYFDEIGIDDIIQEVGNVNLPKEYKEDSFEWVGIELSDGELIKPIQFQTAIKGER
jgi:hypothetical protein